VNAVLNVIWLALAGIWLALGYVLAGTICFILVVTIPFGIGSFKMVPISLLPMGKRLVPSASVHRTQQGAFAG